MARFVWSAALLLAAACTGTDRLNPGQPIGAFHVTAQLVGSSCGPTPNPWQFDVKLRHDATTLFWVQGDAPVAGQLASSRATLTTSVTSTMRDANPKTQTPACIVTRKDTVEVALDTADPSLAQVFAGSLAYHFDAEQGSDCSDQLTEVGGDFDALPCDVSYTLAGKRTADLPK